MPKDKEAKYIADLYNKENVLIDIQQLFNFQQIHGKKSENLFKKSQEQSAQSKIIKKLRITRKNEIMDCFTFSRDYIDSLDNLLNNFYVISKKQLFSIFTLKKVQENINSNNISPHWLTRNVFNTIQDWVVGYFEINIIKFETLYPKLMFQNREAFIEIWKSLDEAQKDKMIQNSLNIINQFDDNVFLNNDSYQTAKGKDLNHNELLFKLLMKLNNYYEDDLEEKSYMNKKQKLKIFKENLIKKFKELIIFQRNKIKEHNFVKGSISFNLKMALELNQFFQNLFVNSLQSLYIQKQFEDDTETKKKQKQNKKNKRKRKKAKKKQQEDHQNENEGLKQGSNEVFEKILTEEQNKLRQKNSNYNSIQGFDQVYKEDLQKKDNNKNEKECKQKEMQKQQIKKNNSQELSNTNKKGVLKTLIEDTEQNSRTECKEKKEEQCSTENSFLNQKNYQIKANQTNIKKFEQNFQFKKLSNSKIIQNQHITKKEHINVVEIKVNQTKSQLQLSRNSSKEYEQQDWYVQPKKNKKQKKNRYKKRRKNINSNNNLDTSKKQKKAQVVQNIQLSKPINYLTKLNKWDDKDEQLKKQEKFLFQNESQSQEEIQEILRNKIQKVVNSKFDIVLVNIINKIQSATNKQDQGRSIIKKRLNQIVKKSLQTSLSQNNVYNFYVQEYGSYATKILTPFSDVDFYIQFPYDIDKETAIENLKVIHENLIQQKFIKSSQDILTASIPLLKIVADPSIQYQDSKQTKMPQNIKVDLTANLKCHNLFNSSYLTTDFIKCSCTVYKSLRKNMIFMKYLFTIKQLNNAYLGGLNSYGMCLMYIAFLEIRKSQNSQDLFQLLLQFFVYYGLHFDPSKMVIDLGYGMAYKYNPFISKGYYTFQNMQQIVVNDPTSVVFSNVTSTCTTWLTIQLYFQRVIQNYNNIVQYIFDKISQDNLKTITETQFIQKCDFLLQQKEQFFQNMFECDDFFLNPQSYLEQQHEQKF